MLAAADFDDRFAALLQSKREDGADVDQAVTAIIEQVREGGDAALIELTNRFDRREVSSMAELALDRDSLAAAWERIDDDLRAAITTAAEEFVPFMKNNCPRRLIIRMQKGFASGCAMALLMRPGSMCPGARLPILHRC